MDQDFMLHSDTAVRLFHEYAEPLPIYDYHCHLNPQTIYEDRTFRNITELMLDGDHYKWRLMRACGIEEPYITGDASDYEKFRAYCSALQYAIGNPLYHWTHLELQRYFHVDTVVTEATCDAIWEQCNHVIAEEAMSPSYLMQQSRVAVLCTTDSPLDSLCWHQKIEASGQSSATVRPAFRPDALLAIEQDAFLDSVQTLSEVCGREIATYDDLVDAMDQRMDEFHHAGCRISDHSLGEVPFCADLSAQAIFAKRMCDQTISREEEEAFKTQLLLHLAEKYRALHWVMQLHLGAMRDNNTAMKARMGADSGFDAMSDGAVAHKLSRLLDAMAQSAALPKTILYALNPKDYEAIAALMGSFQSAEAAGYIQLGAAWWFNDHRDGIKTQLRTVANFGSLRHFVGILTDSRSFLSYSRHEYFRRILCNLIGQWVDDGEFPRDYDILGRIVSDISFYNAKQYFGI